MESERRIRQDVPTNNKTSEKPRKEGNRDAYYEVWWPLFASTLELRPLHMWNVGRKANIQEGQRVLELGAGYPLWRIYSGRVGNTGTFIALDINETISKRSRKITKLFNLGKKRQSEQIITADANNLPFSDESTDLVIANNLPEGENAYKEAFRVLKPKGRLISTNTGFLINPCWLTNIGFTDVQESIGIPFSRFVTGSKPSPKDTLR